MDGNWALTYIAHRYRREIGFLHVLYTNIGQKLRSNIQCMETMEWNWVLTYAVQRFSPEKLTNKCQIMELKTEEN